MYVDDKACTIPCDKRPATCYFNHLKVERTSQMAVFRKNTGKTMPSTQHHENSRVKRLPDETLTLDVAKYLNKNISRKYAKDGQYTGRMGILRTPSGKMFGFPSLQASSIEIEDLGAESGRILETAFLKFMSEIGVPKRDILKPAKLVPSIGNREEEFSDGVILFGDTAFLLQMKHRNSTESDTYASSDKYQTIRRNVEKAKIQYYSSLVLAGNAINNNLVKMESLSGDLRIIDIEKYNWVSIVLTNRNYFGETDKPLVMNSKMNSPQDGGLDHVNHVVLTLQGVVNLFNLFSSYYALLSYWKMLSKRPREYELCAEIPLAYNIYGKFYGLEDNSLRFVRLITKAVNQFFNDGILTKNESAHILEPLYSLNDENLEELFVNIENNFTESSMPSLFAWNGPKSKHLILLDYAGKISAIADKDIYFNRHANYRPDRDFVNYLDPYRGYYSWSRSSCDGYMYYLDCVLEYNKKYSDKDIHLSLSTIDSFSELSNISISTNRTAPDKKAATQDILDIFKLNRDNSLTPNILKIVVNDELNSSAMDVIVLGDIVFVPQVVEANIEMSYTDSMFADFLSLQHNLHNCSELFIKTVEKMEKLETLKAKNDTGEIVDLSFSKYHWVSLLVLDGEFTLDSHVEDELYDMDDRLSHNKTILNRQLQSPPTILISVDSLSRVIDSLERSGVVYDFFRRIITRRRVTNLCFGEKALFDYMDIIGDMIETKNLISNFNASVLSRFVKGDCNKHAVRRIFSIFDNLDNSELRTSFEKINTQIQKSLKIADRFTLTFENPYVLVFFTICNGLTIKEKHCKKLLQELTSRRDAQNADFIVGVLLDVVQNTENVKHAITIKSNVGL